jgi:hypothetical protein
MGNMVLKFNIIASYKLSLIYILHIFVTIGSILNHLHITINLDYKKGKSLDSNQFVTISYR